MIMREKLIVVGASVAAAAFVDRLRELGYSEAMLVIDTDPDAPHDRPPLSKRFMTSPDTTDISLNWDTVLTPITWATALSMNAESRTLTVLTSHTGRERVIEFDRLVIATGAEPVHLPIEPDGVLAFRTASDARRIRDMAVPGKRAAIIGAGAIGVELASSLRTLGVEVTVIDRAVAPLERLLSGYLGADVTSWLEVEGIECVWRAMIESIDRTDSGWEVSVAGRLPVVADFVITAVGAKPAVGWLRSSGLLQDGALLVDGTSNVVVDGKKVPGIFAIGDVASREVGDGRIIRTESWTAAREQGTRLAEDLRGVAHETDSLPYFWTEVAGRMIQVAGELPANGAVTVEFENPQRRSVLYRVEGSNGTTGWIGVNAQPRIAQLMRAAETAPSIL
jgi:3-phenylpropionate/trans-cinnamate dioxygenase ferredoxin reductase subunit